MTEQPVVISDTDDGDDLLGTFVLLVGKPSTDDVFPVSMSRYATYVNGQLDTKTFVRDSDLSPFTDVGVFPSGVAGRNLPSTIWFYLGDRQTSRTLSSLSVVIGGVTKAATVPQNGGYFSISLTAAEISTIAGTLDGSSTYVSVSLNMSFSDESGYDQEVYILVNNAGFELAVPVGTVIAWARSQLPAGWLRCDGSALSRTDYPSLWDAIGSRFGAGDGSTTFNLPSIADLRTNVEYLIKM